MFDEAIQSVWNFDGAELQAIFEIKKGFIRDMLNWDLESAFWKLRILRMEIDAKLVRKYNKNIIDDDSVEEQESKKNKKELEKVLVDRLLNDLETVRNEFNNLSQATLNDRSNYYIHLENFYMELCVLMKKHGLYFREGEDSAYAILRR